ncbi:MAG: hypothetical protein CSYNP_03764 [Syntrophus sp. SKADARSKE-3]|nr:hypothetical protein [Syntrophus sp. SKADARSKE-3]
MTAFIMIFVMGNMIICMKNNAELTNDAIKNNLVSLTE